MNATLPTFAEMVQNILEHSTKSQKVVTFKLPKITAAQMVEAANHDADILATLQDRVAGLQAQVKRLQTRVYGLAHSEARNWGATIEAADIHARRQAEMEEEEN